jgi:hypothetical protein
VVRCSERFSATLSHRSPEAILALDKFKAHITATTFFKSKRYKKKNGAWGFESWCVKMFKLLEQLQLFDADTVSVKRNKSGWI